MKRVLVYAVCDYFSLPNGGEVMLLNNFLSANKSEMIEYYLVGMSFNESDKVGKWCDKKIGNIVYKFLPVSQVLADKEKTHVPFRLRMVYGLKKYWKNIEKINGINGQEKILHRMEEIFRRGGKFICYGMDKSTFEENVMLIDSLMPRILGEALLIYYGEVKKLQVEEEKQEYKVPAKNVEEEAAEYGRKSNHISSCEEVLDIITKRNPLGYPNPENMYKYKFKKLLSAIALGMMPGSKWNGRDQANGGYIIVSHSGDVLAYHIYNRDFFEEYLFRNTKFESPGSGRHRYGDLYEQDGKIFMKLNLQIRFR